MEILWIFTILFILLPGILLLSTKKDSRYYSKRGIRYLGNMSYSMILHNFTLADNSLYWYQKAKGQNLKIAGLKELLTPTIIVTDLDLIKKIMVKDFEHFVDRRSFHLSNRDYLFKKALSVVTGEHWKSLRTKLSPTFTAAKIRRMFKIFDTSCKKLVFYLEKETENCSQIDLTEGYIKFTTDAVASAAFGLDSGAFNQKQPSEFQSMGEKLKVGCRGLEILKFLFMELFPKKCSELLGLSFFPLNVQQYYSQIIQAIIKLRKESGEKREDFIQNMIEAKEEQMNKEDKGTKDFEKNNSNEIKFDDDDITAQGVQILVASLDAINASLLFLAYVLALNPDVQDRLYKEISNSLEETNGEFSYESIHKMEYLDMVMNETMRLYAPTTFTNRACTKDYRIPESNITIKKGEVVFISIFGLHRDPQNYEDPERFDPERWTAGNASKIHPYAFLPFGHGPRNCLGMRFAIAQIKLAVVHLVQNFIIEPCEKTPIRLKFASSLTLKPEGGMWLSMNKRT